MIHCAIQAGRKEKLKKNNMTAPELNLPISIRVMRAQTWLVAVLILSSLPNAFAESEFSTFWQKFKSSVIAGDRAAIADMTKFPLSMPYGVKAVKNKDDFLRRYNEIFKGETNASRCFPQAEQHKESDRRYEVYCPFKGTPNDWENAPIRFIFELTKTGWRFAGFDNINE